MVETKNPRMLINMAVSLALVVSSVGCTTRLMRRVITREAKTVPLCPSATDGVEVEYLGSGGLVFRRGAQAIATGPYITNADFLTVASDAPIDVDPALADSLLPSLNGISAMLVGHSHYDHLMDAAYLFDKLDDAGATLYGNQTAKHLIASLFTDRPDAVVAVNERAGDRNRAGDWLPSETSAIRFMAIESEHAPHIRNITFLKGHQDSDLAELPRRASAWVEGRKTYSYLIDFLDGATPVFRIFYQDTASNAPKGLPPASVLDEKGVDVAVLCVSSFQNVEDYPGSFLRELDPRHVILGHWESFFRNPLEEPRVLKGTNLKEFIRRVERDLSPGSDWTLPQPRAKLSFEFCPDSTKSSSRPERVVDPRAMSDGFVDVFARSGW